MGGNAKTRSLPLKSSQAGGKRPYLNKHRTVKGLIKCFGDIAKGGVVCMYEHWEVAQRMYEKHSLVKREAPYTENCLCRNLGWEEHGFHG